MPTLIRCEIDGVDRSAYLVGIEGLAPAGYGEVGTATLIFKRDATLAYSLQDKQRVEVGLHNGTNWVMREFGGWVSDIDIQNTVPAEFLAVGCQDNNIQLDVLVKDPLSSTIFGGGVTFAAMVQSVVTAYNGTAAKQIDATSKVANLIPTAIMPTVTVPGDSSLREALQLVMDAAQLTNPALRPRFFLTTDDTVNPLFGNIVLSVYDGALVPGVSFRFSDNPGVGQKPIYGEFKIKDDGTATRNRRYLKWREDAAVLGADATSIATYPNPYSPTSAWMGKAITNTQLDDVTQAQAQIDGLVAESAYFRRTITFGTIERVIPGMVVGVSWAKESMVDVGYYVVGVDADYSDPLEPMRTLTLNAAVLEFGEHGGRGGGGLTIPHTPPTPPVHNAPTPHNADGSYGTYNGGLGRTIVNLNWTHSISPQVVDYLADVTYEGRTVRISTGYVTTYPLSLPPNTAFSVVLYAFNMWGQISPVSSSAQAGTTQRAPANMIYNGSMELGSDDPSLLAGWALTLAGSSTVMRSAVQAYDQTFCADLNRVSSANCKMTSQRMAVDYTKSYLLTYWVLGSTTASYLQVDVLEYGPGDTPTSTGTQTFTDPLAPVTWVQVKRTLTFPLNTTQVEVRYSNIFAGSAHAYVDAVYLTAQIVNEDLGTITDSAKFRLRQDAGTPRYIDDNTGTSRAKEFYNTSGYLEYKGINAGATPIGFKASDDTGAAFMLIDPAAGTPTARLQGNTASLTNTTGLGVDVSSTGTKVTGAQYTTYTAVSANTTLTSAHHVVGVNCTSGNKTITLPAASGNAGLTYVIGITNNLGNSLTIDPNGAELINGAATYVFSTLFQFVRIICDGSAWYVID